jgi:general secretion pathway protein I
MRGFTLLEVMIAVAILSGVVLTVISAFNYQLSLASRSIEDNSVLLLARSKLEELHFTGRDKTEGEQAGTFAPERPDVKWKLERGATELPVMKRLVLNVEWSGGRKKLSLENYVAQ